MPRDTHNSEKLPPSLYAALGRLMVAFQALEETITFGVFRLTRASLTQETDLPYFLALQELPFKNRLKLLRNFMELNGLEFFMYPNCPAEEQRRNGFPQMIASLREALKKAANLEEKRNQYVHSVWLPSAEIAEDAAMRFKIRIDHKAIKVTEEKIDAATIESLVEEVQSTRNAIDMGSQFFGAVLAEKFRVLHGIPQPPDEPE